MTWEKTVMSEEEITRAIGRMSLAEWNEIEDSSRRDRILQAERTGEIAFKAGIREVVEILRKTGWDRAADDVEIYLGIKEEK